jgi:coproporphyrinogen III oxidase-like Fe-S oxidoreductase
LFSHYRLKSQQLAGISESTKTKLLELERDGLIILTSGGLEVTKLGFPFLRNIASAFDHHLRKHSFAEAL